MSSFFTHFQRQIKRNLRFEYRKHENVKIYDKQHIISMPHATLTPTFNRYRDTFMGSCFEKIENKK